MEEKLKKTFIVTILLFFCVAGDGFSFLTTKGKDIVDANGRPFVLKGIGLGGWLVPEGYMLHTSAVANSPTQIRNKIMELIGIQATDQFFSQYRANYVTEKDIQKIAEWGFNSIRLPCHFQDFSPKDQPGVFIEDGFQIVDQLLNWCKTHQLYLILDLHCAPGGQNPEPISDSDGVARLWTESQNQDRTVEIWQKIAERYVNEPWIGGYDLLNEPVLPQGYNSTVLRSLYLRITSAIRQVDKNHIVFIEGNWFATDFSSLTPPWDTNMVYSFHKYWSETSQASIQPYLDIRRTYSVPLWLGEAGENSNTWFFNCVKLMEENNIGWCWWPHKKIDTVTSPLSSPISEKYQRVLDYWNGEAARPRQDFARQALMEMATNLAIEKCELHQDVLVALFQKYPAGSAPFKSHNIPGIIQCADYDFGRINVAYYDKDDQQTRWDLDQPWNKGWRYRNDGVDIEKCEDPEGTPFNIGWIDNGEWLSYTVNMLVNGKYDIVFRVASPNSGGKIQLWLDGQLRTEFEIPVTVGWQKWESVQVKKIEMTAGEHIIKLLFVKGGFNISSMQFIANDNGVYEKITDYVLVGQNYPNPFNLATRIPIRVDKKAFFKLNIYNLKGELLKRMVNEEVIPGLYQISWDGSNQAGLKLASGVYFYRIELNDASMVKAMLLVK